MAVAPQIQARHPEDQVFKMKGGGEVTTQALQNKAWKLALRAAKLDGLKKSPRVHDLRHTYASWMLGGRAAHEHLRLIALDGASVDQHNV